MKTISRFQLIELSDDRMAFRYYNEEKDAFEKVCVAKKVEQIDDLVVADEKLYYEYQGKLYFISEDAVHSLVAADDGSRVCVLNVEDKPFPFPLLVVEFDVYPPSCYPIKSYSVSTVTKLDGRQVSYGVEDYYDDLGHYEGSTIFRR